MAFTSHYLTCAGREIHYTQWGAQHADTVIAWHGLARTGRDMDELAEHLSERYRVICPDTIGRGLSQWSTQPVQEYCLSFYARIAAELFEQAPHSHGALGRHLDGWRDRHRVRGRPDATRHEGAHPESGAQRQRAQAGRRRAGAHSRLRRRATGL